VVNHSQNTKSIMGMIMSYMGGSGLMFFYFLPLIELIFYC